MGRIFEAIDYEVVTSADIEAYMMLQRSKGKEWTAADNANDIIDAGNEVILLAEKIKAERSATILQGMKLALRRVQGTDL